MNASSPMEHKAADLASPSRPKVSVITPTLGYASMIKRALDAVANQTMRHWEHIIYVAEQDEACLSIVAERAAEDPRIKFVTGPAAFASVTRNRALQHASGSYLNFLDADDSFSPKHLELLLAKAEHYKAGLVVGGYRRIAPDGQVFATKHAPANLKKALSQGPISALHALLFDRQMVTGLGGFDPALTTNEDWDLCLRMSLAGADLVPLDSTSADYWTGHASLSSDPQKMLAGRLAGEQLITSMEEFSADERPVSESILKTAVWTGALAIARGTKPDVVYDFLCPIPPASADIEEGVATLLDALSVGFACRPDLVEDRMYGCWEPLSRFLYRIEKAVAQDGYAQALLRDLECNLARLGSSVNRRRINGSECISLAHAPFARIVVGPSTDHVIVRIPGLRPRRFATLAFAPQVAANRRLASLVIGRAIRRIRHFAASGHDTLFPLRSKLFRATALTRRLVNIFRTSGKPAEEHTPEPQELTGENRWEVIFGQEDPWNYTCPYETTKYERTMELLPDVEFGSALEMACAEGLFTARLAPKVQRLHAIDISATALGRANDHCKQAGASNVDFEKVDFFEDDFGHDWDLIVCSEVLYYMADRGNLAGFADRVTAALNPGGYFLHAHAYEVSDSPGRTGFEWGDDFAAATISYTFMNQDGLTLVRAIETELYRIELYCKTDQPVEVAEVDIRTAAAELSAELAADIVWDKAFSSRNDVEAERSARVPVLAYHSIAADGLDGLADWRIDPETFERHLRFLRRRGYRSISLHEWTTARKNSGVLSGRPILITFDDGYEDFAQTAWPILKRNGFSAVVFIVTDAVGKTADWDDFYGSPRQLMDWDTIGRLAEEGVEFGSHLASHRSLKLMSYEESYKHMIRSREAFEREVGLIPTAIAPPYGIFEAAHEELAWQAGFDMLFRIDGGIAPVFAPHMSIPRVEVTRAQSLSDLAQAIGSDLPPYPWEGAA